MNLTATQDDVANLERLYKGKAACHGDTHGHSASSEYSDGKHTLAAWKAHMRENQIDFATIVDHGQTLHMTHPDWDDTVFIGGSEPGVHITDIEVVSRDNIDYALIITDVKQFEAYLKTFPEYKFADGIKYCEGRFRKGGHFADHAKVSQMIQCIKEHGGMFSYVHPMGKNRYYDPVDPMNHWFADETGFEVSNTAMGGYDSESNVRAYETWVYLINNGKRIWATSGSDCHGALPLPYVLSTVYATQKNADGYFAEMKNGNITAGPVGIRIVVGDTATGGKCSFAGNRVVMAAGDFHPLAIEPEHTYRLDIYDETGLIASQELSTTQMNYVAFDAREDALYYRANVYDVTGNVVFAVGNPIWNA